MIGVLQFIFRLPWMLLLATLALVFVGASGLYSASQGSWAPWAEQHLVRAAMGGIIVSMMTVLPARWIFKWSYLGLLGALCFLLILQFIGVGTGATRWIAIAGFNFQPSEPAKLAVILALARYLSEQTPEQLQEFVTYVPAMALAGVPFALVLIQPDLGTSLMLLAGGLTVIFAAGVPRRFIFGAIVTGLASLPILWAQLYDYQKARVMTFLNPDADQLGAGYQIAQSKIALGSGGLFGKGYLMGSQSQLNYLPEKQTDFVFTMIGEEFGFIGNVTILIIYFIILTSIILIALRCENRFARLSCIGVSMMIFLYMFVNVAMVTGLMPVVGAPLPLISYGGTAMLTVFTGIGIVVNASINSHLEDSDYL
jgi:rod shape determining protein RodA